MGASEDNEKINEKYTGHKGVPYDIIDKARKSICKIIIKKK